MENHKSWINTGIVLSIAPLELRQAAKQPTVDWFSRLAVLCNDNAKMDGRQLLWCLMKSRLWERPRGSIEDMILQELASYLYPEFDGENVAWREWGWETAGGDLRYI